MEIKFERQIDELGRLVIPVDLRKAYSINPGDKLSIIPQDNGILIVPNRIGQDDNDKEEN